MRGKVSGERERDAGRTERRPCCGCEGLWHDDLGQKTKITLPGITTLLQCPLQLLLEEDTWDFIQGESDFLLF